MVVVEKYFHVPYAIVGLDKARFESVRIEQPRDLGYAVGKVLSVSHSIYNDSETFEVFRDDIHLWIPPVPKVIVPGSKDDRFFVGFRHPDPRWFERDNRKLIKSVYGVLADNYAKEYLQDNPKLVNTTGSPHVSRLRLSSSHT